MFTAVFALGCAVGLSLALTGAGGGVLAVPLLVFGLGLEMAKAAPIALVTVGLSAALGAALGLRKRKLHYRAALLMGGAGMVAAPFGVALAKVAPEGLLSFAFAGTLVASAVIVWRRTARKVPMQHQVSRAPCVVNPRTGRLRWTQTCAAMLGSTGMAAGFLGGLLGVGGGFVMVPSMLRYTDLAIDGVVSTSLAVIAMVSIAGMASAALQGTLDLHVAGPFALGASTALVAGRTFAQRWSGATLQRCFAGLSLLVALLLLWRGLDRVAG